MGGDPGGRYLVGRSFGPDGHYHPLLWTDGRLTVLDATGTDAEVDGISVNSSGVVAWSSGQSAGNGYAYHTYVYDAGKVTRVAAADGYHVLRVDEAGDLYGIDEASAGGVGAGPGNGKVLLLTVPARGTRAYAISRPGTRSAGPRCSRSTGTAPRSGSPLGWRRRLERARPRPCTGARAVRSPCCPYRRVRVPACDRWRSPAVGWAG
jgi:hypothetical protein